MTEKFVASGFFEGMHWTLYYNDRTRTYYTTSVVVDPKFFTLGDRVFYYQDAGLTGTIAEVKPVTTMEAVYAVYWDTDEPNTKSGWYTYSMLFPLPA